MKAFLLTRLKGCGGEWLRSWACCSVYWAGSLWAAPSLWTTGGKQIKESIWNILALQIVWRKSWLDNRLKSTFGFGLKRVRRRSSTAFLGRFRREERHHTHLCSGDLNGSEIRNHWTAFRVRNMYPLSCGCYYSSNKWSFLSSFISSQSGSAGGSRGLFCRGDSLVLVRPVERLLWRLHCCGELCRLQVDMDGQMWDSVQFSHGAKQKSVINHFNHE